MKNCKTCGKTFYNYTSIDTLCPKCKIKASVERKYKSGTSYRFGVKSSTRGLKKAKTGKQKAKANAWKWFSRYIRLKYSFNGVCKCYTCGAFHSIKSVDAGHWITRGKTAVLFDEDNCRPQCKKCNRFQQGRSYDFEMALIEEIGAERVQELKDKARQNLSLSELEYQAVAETYKMKVKELQEIKGKYF